MFSLVLFLLAFLLFDRTPDVSMGFTFVEGLVLHGLVHADLACGTGPCYSWSYFLTYSRLFVFNRFIAVDFDTRINVHRHLGWKMILVCSTHAFQCPPGPCWRCMCGLWWERQDQISFNTTRAVSRSEFRFFVFCCVLFWFLFVFFCTAIYAGTSSISIPRSKCFELRVYL